jgi:hypothetical protein
MNYISKYSALFLLALSNITPQPPNHLLPPLTPHLIKYIPLDNTLQFPKVPLISPYEFPEPTKFSSS